LVLRGAIAPVTLNNGRTIFVADAHRDDGKRFVVRADERLTTFLELESRFEPLRIVLTSWRNFIQTWSR